MSVFTFDPDPPRVSSPWLRTPDPGKKPAPEQSAPSLKSGLLSEYGVTKLEAEPQHGPTEYKLHLLLRPRRTYQSMSTTTRVPGSTQSRPSPSELKSAKFALPSLSPSSQTRQARLEHLTTQLLWRLQQSCPYHAASTASELVIPQLPDESVGPNGAVKIGKLLPGLEASRGALYELGVADDGTLVGLTQDEMDESLATLQTMAASLGCRVGVLRMVIVGHCEWIDVPDGCDQRGPNSPASVTEVHHGKLWVAEALVTPELVSRDPACELNSPDPRPGSWPAETPVPTKGPLTTQQLRVTLTGPTTSGKSTLLGTLSTGTLDNGFGKSRLSLLKHRHEVATGVTSSVAQELIGYNHNSIFNYTHGGIESWIDIHDFTKDGRLVFLLDSAGHPRYRRTILRGIVSWAPDWTLLCIAADDMETGNESSTSSGEDVSGVGIAGPGVDLAKAHLDLCLDLELPLAIVITKLDLAKRTTLQRTLGKVLSSIKAAGRSPKILQPDQSNNHDLTEVPGKDIDSVGAVIDAINQAGNLQSIVPIVLTSAVKGSGIGLVHALLQSLPLPPAPTPRDYIGPALNPEQPACLFHIDDLFSLPAFYASLNPRPDEQTDLGSIVAGYLRFGSLSVGDKVVIGPFPSDEDDARGLTPDDRRPSLGNLGLSISHPSSAELTRIAMKNAVSASTIKGEWHSANIVSIHNLRLPVQTLEAGQVGSIGIVLDCPEEEPSSDSFFEPLTPAIPKLRKGMVLAIPSKHMIDTGLSLQAASGLTAAFPSLDTTSFTVGGLVNIYVASVRAAARVIAVTQNKLSADPSGTDTGEPDEIFNFNEQADIDEVQPKAAGGVEVQLELLTNREWIELGSRILILEGGHKDKSGLEAFVGKVVEIVD